MLNRTTTLTSTAFATVLAGTGLMYAGCTPARAADDCLNAPNHEMSAGGHWHYRLDRRKQRKCWYLAAEGHDSEQVPSVKPARSTKKDSQQATETIQQSNADAHSEIPALKYTEQPNLPRALEQPYAEPFADAPPKSIPEHPVPMRENGSLDFAIPVESEPPAANPVADAVAGAAPAAFPTADNHQAVVEVPADDTGIGAFRLTLALLLMGTGVTAVMAPVVFKRSGPLRARRNPVPLSLQDTAGESEEDLEKMASLAFSQDVPLFLVRGRPGPD